VDCDTVEEVGGRAEEDRAEQDNCSPENVQAFIFIGIAGVNVLRDSIHFPPANRRQLCGHCGLRVRVKAR